MKPKAAGMSDVGRCRKANQDQFLVDMPLGLYAIADGMGGHAAGEVASELAISALAESLRSAHIIVMPIVVVGACLLGLVFYLSTLLLERLAMPWRSRLIA